MCSPCRSVLAAALILGAGACRREARNLHPSAQDWRPAPAVQQSTNRAGEAAPLPPLQIPQTDNAWALNEGKRLYSWFNCVGCHAHGGGGMGPALMDDKWIYGSEPQNIFATVVEGRPNGMPSFRGKIPEPEVWQLVAYVRSLAGLVPKLAAPSRDDHMQVAPQESNAAKGHPMPAEGQAPP